jgi:hypothetical protein
MDWAIYGALLVGFFACAGAIAYLVVCALQAWRSLKRLRRRLGKELDGLARLTEETSESAARATDQTKLAESTDRLRVSLARFAVLRSALDEAADAAGRVTSVYPRK